MQYKIHLSRDKKMKRLIDAGPAVRLKKNKQVYLHLCGSIMSQQLSVKVADVLWKRFLALYDAVPTPQVIAETPPATLRAIGLSNAKVSYILNVAHFALEQGMEWKQLQKMTNDDISRHLVRIKGVGQWTTEMILMFALGREDVFAVDDLGIQHAMQAIYKLDKTDKKKFRADLLRVSARWSPYRTYACLYLWQWKDNSPKK
jgi:DNA-3-methyladenine glycosylase II